jgi:hypothetical protein
MAGLAKWALVVLLMGTGTAQGQSILGCQMGLTLQNAAQGAIDVEAPSFEIRSRLATAVAGPWRRAQSGGWQPDAVRLRMLAGAQLVDSYDTQALCNDRRQFRLSYICRHGPRRGQRFQTRFPSVQSDWSRAQNVTIRVGTEC